MDKFLNGLRENIFIIILMIVAIITHIPWFNPTSILTFSDWYYWPSEAVKQLFYSWGTWLSFWNLGSPNIQIFFFPFDLVWSFIVNSGFSYDFATKITFFIPIALLGFISPYLLIKRLIKDNLISFVSALFYGSTTYFLVLQTAHLPIAFVYSISPLIFMLFINAFEKNNVKSWLFFALAYSLGAIYEVRITYVLSIVLGLYFVFFYFKGIRKYLKYLIIVTFLILFINLFWILPIIFSHNILTSIENVANRGLFGGDLTNVEYAFSLFHWSWTGRMPNETFNPQAIALYFWVLPLIIFSPFTFSNFSYKKNNVFFLIVSLLGIFFVKQSSIPFSNIYLLFYKYFPGFNLFRESSKFYLLISLGYLGLLSSSILFIKSFLFAHKKNFIYYIFTFFLCVSFLFNLKPLIIGEMGTLFVSRHIPKDYLIVKNFVLKQNNYFRTLWSPVNSRWSIYTDNHPIVDAVSGVSSYSYWNNYVNKLPVDKYPTGQIIMKVLSLPLSNNLLDISSIKYVFVPLEDKANDDDFFPNYGEPRQYYINQLNKIPWLHKINIGTKDLVVYENYRYRPHIYITNNQETISKEQPYKTVDYKFITPSQYSVQINNVKGLFYLNFSESYNSGWKVYLGKFEWYNVLFNKQEAISNKDHFENNAGLNSFYINPSQVCKVESCKVNKDGSYDIDMTLYFAPQSYMYLGLIISGGTLVLVLGYLVIVLGRNIYDKRKN